MPDRDLLSPTAKDGQLLLAAAESDWERPIPHCPGWDAAQLTGHMGSILDWMARIVSTGERVSRRDRDPPPDDRDRLSSWFAAHLDRTLGVLTSVDPDRPTWTFSSRDDHRAGWWCRRLAVELAIHRWDAQDAAGTDTGTPALPLDGVVAAAGIGEFFIEFLPGILARNRLDGLRGGLALHATDDGAEWLFDLDAGTEAPTAQQQSIPIRTTVRASRSDLLLWLTNRKPGSAVDVHGDGEVVVRWVQVRR